VNNPNQDSLAAVPLVRLPRQRTRGTAEGDSGSIDWARCSRACQRNQTNSVRGMLPATHLDQPFSQQDLHLRLLLGCEESEHPAHLSRDLCVSTAYQSDQTRRFPRLHKRGCGGTTARKIAGSPCSRSGASKEPACRAGQQKSNQRGKATICEKHTPILVTISSNVANYPTYLLLDGFRACLVGQNLNHIWNRHQHFASLIVFTSCDIGQTPAKKLHSLLVNR
jgi:hypothetical protein